MKLIYGKFKPVVIAYGVILFAMVLISGSLALNFGWEKTPLNLIFIGGVSNLIAFTDYNKLQIDDTVAKVNDIAPLADKWKAFGWNVIDVADGNDVDQVSAAVKLAKANRGSEKPTMVILNTRKGCGVKWIDKLMPPVIIGPTVAIIGLSLAGNAIGDLMRSNVEGGSVYVALICGLVTLAVTMLCSTYGKHMIKLIPFIIGILAGYLVASIFALVGKNTGITACTAQQGAGYTVRCGGNRVEVLLAQLRGGVVDGETHVGAGISVRNREHIQVIDRLDIFMQCRIRAENHLFEGYRRSVGKLL